MAKKMLDPYEQHIVRLGTREICIVEHDEVKYMRGLDLGAFAGQPNTAGKTWRDMKDRMYLAARDLVFREDIRFESKVRNTKYTHRVHTPQCVTLEHAIEILRIATLSFDDSKKARLITAENANNAIEQLVAILENQSEEVSTSPTILHVTPDRLQQLVNIAVTHVITNATPSNRRRNGHE